MSLVDEISEPSLGKTLLKEGAVALLVVAGGQATRLKFQGPKGAYPVGLQNESLFELISKKVIKASNHYGTKITMCVMTSSQNDLETKAFFKKNHFFGLEKEQLKFFSQEELPFLDEEKKPFLLEGKQVLAPDGNGYALHYFAKSGLLKELKEKGVKLLSFILVDNALTNPFEERAIGYHEKQGADVTLKAIYRKNPLEKLGTLVLKEGKTNIVEYSELKATDIDLYPLGNMGEFLFSFSFIEQIQNQKLPIHLAKKEVIPNVFANKQETFIFDLLPFSKKTEVVVYPRERFFSPLKNATGENSKESVQSDLLKEQKFDRLDNL